MLREESKASDVTIAEEIRELNVCAYEGERKRNWSVRENKQ